MTKKQKLFFLTLGVVFVGAVVGALLNPSQPTVTPANPSPLSSTPVPVANLVALYFMLPVFSLIAAWMGLSLVASNIARKKGRSGGALFLLSFFCSPLVGIVVALLLSTDQAQLNQQAQAAGTMKRC